MFLVPLTILFAAVGVANTRFVKLLVWTQFLKRPFVRWLILPVTAPVKQQQRHQPATN
jgi:hypothetical protein